MMKHRGMKIVLVVVGIFGNAALTAAEYGIGRSGPYTAEQLNRAGAGEFQRGLKSRELEQEAAELVSKSRVAAQHGDNERAARLMNESREKAAEAERWAPTVRTADRAYDGETKHQYSAAQAGAAASDYGPFIIVAVVVGLLFFGAIAIKWFLSAIASIFRSGK
jgi:hypothetical protein